MKLLVTGAAGVLGRQLVTQAIAAGHQVRAGSRRTRSEDFVEWVQLDLAAGTGVETAVDGVDAILHCASDFKNHAEADVKGTRRLIAASGPHTHIVYPGIVGSDVIPIRYYASKIAVEEIITARPWTVIRMTQFHQFAWAVMARLSRPPVMMVPGDSRIQPLDPATGARLMLEAAATGPAGRAPDIGGPFAYEVKEVARSYLAATGTRRPVLALKWPGLAWAALRAGGNLTPNRDTNGATWNDFLDRRRNSDSVR